MNQIRKPTPERIEYEESVKNLRLLDLKAKLSEVGIDTSKVPRQKLDEILRGIEQQNNTYRESQLKIQIIQQATQDTINKIAQEGEALVESLKKKYLTYNRGSIPLPVNHSGVEQPVERVEGMDWGVMEPGRGEAEQPVEIVEEKTNDIPKG